MGRFRSRFAIRENNVERYCLLLNGCDGSIGYVGA